MSETVDEWKAWHAKVLRYAFIALISSTLVLFAAASSDQTPTWILITIGGGVAGSLLLIAWIMHSVLYPTSRFSKQNINFSRQSRRGE